MDMFKRITFNADIMGGKACIRRMRIPVSLILNLVANGMNVQEIIKEYPDLEPEDIKESLHVSWLLNEGTYYAAGA